MRVNPTIRLQPTAAPSEPSDEGDYELELLDSSGTALRSLRFAASVSVADVGPGGVAGGGIESWVVAVKDPPDYHSYRITRRSQEIAAVERSDTAPVVSVTAPTAGQVLDTETVAFSWTASDADGDTLSYTVQYSIDGGANYQTIATGHDTTTLRRLRSTLPASTRARFRVIASDGARSTTAESAVFTVAGNAPAVHIDSPADMALAAGPQTLVLSATAYDPEDGLLEGSAISWSSSIDGALGTGAQLGVAALDLSEGTHTLTATATDSSNMAGTASVTVTVARDNAAPSAADDTVYAVSGGRAAIADVVGNDSDPDDGIAASTLAIIAPPAAGAARVLLDPQAGRVVAYTPDASGYDALVYRVCDTFGQCDTAELTVAVSRDH